MFLDLVITESSQRECTGLTGAEGIEFYKSSFGDICELFRNSFQAFWDAVGLKLLEPCLKH